MTVEPSERERARLQLLIRHWREVGEEALDVGLAYNMGRVSEEEFSEKHAMIERRAGILVVRAHEVGVFDRFEGLAKFAQLTLTKREREELEELNNDKGRPSVSAVDIINHRSTSEVGEIFKRAVVWLKQPEVNVPSAARLFLRETHVPTTDGCRMLEEIVGDHINQDIQAKAGASTRAEQEVIDAINDAGHALTKAQLVTKLRLRKEEELAKAPVTGKKRSRNGSGAFARMLADMVKRGALLTRDDNKGYRTPKVARADPVRWGDVPL